MFEAIYVQTTTECNAKCKMCPHYQIYGNMEPEQMSDEVWDKILSDIKEIDYRGQVGFLLFGEPLTDPKLFQRIKEVNETNAWALVSTNGSLLTSANRKKLIEAHPRQVVFNVPSGDSGQYEALTGLEFKAVSKIQKFIEEAGNIKMSVNVPVIEDVDFEKIYKLFNIPVNIFEATSRGGLLEYHGKGQFTGNMCTQPFKTLSILIDGQIVLCCQDWAQFSNGFFPNILDSSIKEIYESKELETIKSEFAKGNYNKFEFCHNCAIELGYINETERADEGEYTVMPEGSGDTEEISEI